MSATSSYPSLGTRRSNLTTSQSTTAPDPQHLTRIYLSPTKRSLDEFRAICTRADLASHITELVFLGEVIVSADGRACSEDAFKVTMEDRIMDRSLPLRAGSIVCTAFYEDSYALYLNMVDSLKESDTLENGTYDVLVTCLPKLPRLRKIMLQNKIDQPGLNSEWFFFSKGFETGGLVAYEDSTDSKEVMAFEAASEVCSWAQVDKFFEAVRDAGVVVTELALGNGLSDQIQYGIYRTSLFNIKEDIGKLPTDDLMRYIAANLIHLSISSQDSIEGQDLGFWRNFLAGAANLHTLRVYMDSDSQAPHEHGTILSTVLPHLTFTKLHTFEAIGNLDQPTSVRAIWLDAFLTRHAATLQTVELSGILLVNWYRPQNALQSMSRILQSMHSLLGVGCQVAVKLRRRSEHDASECNGSCTRYLMGGGVMWCTRHVMVDGKWLKMTDLDKLARGLAVELRDGQWDFGAYVMRP
ncbi:hypothetical protein LTR36_000531 [Oleoguttula mirabilis]|uniref:Uncharacterized protein n=1 Tax=Oleoguttula mirabilis TaxID=1507867 RepID=A0AAV9JPP6_9PEZI|nr:hypothetical protein LTR36_000531 [Oleoguttula mirabilis]